MLKLEADVNGAVYAFRLPLLFVSDAAIFFVCLFILFFMCLLFLFFVVFANGLTEITPSSTRAVRGFLFVFLYILS